MAMSPESARGTSPFDPAMLPELHVVNFEELETTATLPSLDRHCKPVGGPRDPECPLTSRQRALPE